MNPAEPYERRDAADLFLEQTANESRRYSVLQESSMNVTVTVSKKINTVTTWLRLLFLPLGFPHTVADDYAAYQVWDTAQAFASTISGTLATQEVLRGLGVGEATATPLAATVTWVLKDGCGHISRILFAFTHGNQIDAFSKKWRLYADILNDMAMCVEIGLPRFGHSSWIALCASTCMKSVVAVAGGASRVAMTQHHAAIGNFADVSAKDSAQETAVNLVASVVALLVITCFGSSLLVFMVMVTLHLYCNYMAVRAVCLLTLNEPRFLLAIDKHLMNKIPSPSDLNKVEPLTFTGLDQCLPNYNLNGMRIEIGTSLREVFDDNMTLQKLVQLRDVYKNNNYMLAMETTGGSVHVLLNTEATVDNVLCGYFHAAVLAILLRHELTNTEGSGTAAPYVPSTALLKYLNKSVLGEWPRFRAGLAQAGWNVSKHLLVMEQWRWSPNPKQQLAHVVQSNEAITEREQRIVKSVMGGPLTSRAGTRLGNVHED